MIEVVDYSIGIRKMSIWEENICRLTIAAIDVRISQGRKDLSGTNLMGLDLTELSVSLEGVTDYSATSARYAWGDKGLTPGVSPGACTRKSQATRTPKRNRALLYLEFDSRDSPSGAKVSIPLRLTGVRVPWAMEHRQGWIGDGTRDPSRIPWTYFSCLNAANS